MVDILKDGRMRGVGESEMQVNGLKRSGEERLVQC